MRKRNATSKLLLDKILSHEEQKILRDQKVNECFYKSKIFLSPNNSRIENNDLGERSGRVGDNLMIAQKLKYSDSTNGGKLGFMI